MIRAWVLRVAGAAVVSAVALRLCPEGRPKRAVRLACGLLTALSLLSLAKGLDYAALSRYLTENRRLAEQFAAEAAEPALTETRYQVEADCAAYLMETVPGLEATVTCTWSQAGYWTPAAARLGGVGEAERARAEAVCEADLGIPKEAITWND